MILRIAFLLLSVFSLAPAQTTSVDVAPLVKIADEKEVIVHQWERQAQTQMAFMIVGILCGGLITVLQPWGSKTWCKVAAGLLGIATAAVTGFISKAPVNYSAYEKSVLSVRAKIGTLHDDINFLKTTSNPDDQKVLRDEFTRTVKEINQIHTKLSGDETASVVSPTNIVYAQSSQPAPPAWTYKLPASSSDLYFGGESASRSLSEAKAAAFNQAVDKGTKQLAAAQGSSVTAETITQYVKSSASTADTFFRFDKKSGLFHYYTLLRMDKSFTRPGVFAALAAPVQTKTIPTPPTKKR